MNRNLTVLLGVPTFLTGLWLRGRKVRHWPWFLGRKP